MRSTDRSLKIITLLSAILLLSGSYGKAQRVRTKVIREAATFTNVAGDSSEVFSACFYSGLKNAVKSVTVVASVYNTGSSQWVVVKDTAYSWATASAFPHNNIAFKVCKPNTNMLQLCLGRLHYHTRMKFAFTILDNTNAIINKEIQF